MRIGKKGRCLCLADEQRVQFVRGVLGTNTRAYLVQVSDQRGTCLIESEGWPVPVTAPESYYIKEPSHP